ncbi:MAG: DUF3325 family protein [Pseudomonadota bacterium]
MLLALVFLCAYAGLAAFAFAMPRHLSQATGAAALPGRWRFALRGAGALLLAGSLAAAVIRDGGGLGSLLWIAALGAAGLALVLVLAYWPRLAYVSSWASAGATAALTVVMLATREFIG